MAGSYNSSYNKPYDKIVIKTGLLAAIERQVNALLTLDPVTIKKMSHWFGKVINFQCISPQWSCYVHFEQDRIRLAGSFEGSLDATFTGSSVAFATLATRRNLPFADVTGLSVSGDEALIADLQTIHQQMEIDWERPLCQTFGDIAGHMMAQGLRFVGDHANRGRALVMDNLGEYLQEELRLIPSRVEVEDFAGEVGLLVESMDRLEHQWQAAHHAIDHSNNETDAKS
ncbi:SCP2 domain-containing protein [Endozoicomonas sp. SCSIO W0465]|uniref:ubiquinone biosynthesis accessory factor UbiJ n=1 Tax=Endozoicomonas sp. SCSIO W0465 TaxID=2918516 RepID=UPI0020753B02|nr:SCP2 sterol-binding domain-containing protein [Endozoicomonas sp. SCSIO W0465]USE35344.1 SCP2 sterol-binding domain-containing protein [Endozoicomonas sp. SCSIO W0465]